MFNQEINELSDRELEILRLLATGASNKEIAYKLSISSNTVKVHLRNIFTKIGVASRTEAAMYAVQIGLVETVLPTSSANENSLPLSNNQDAGTSGSNALPGFFLGRDRKIKLPFIFLGVLGIILLVVILIVVLQLQRDNPTTAQISPTTTSRVQWFELPGLPTPRQGLAVINYDNQIYTIGGETLQGISDVVEKFNPQANSWTALSPKPTSVTDISAAVIRGQIYVPGGKLSSGLPTNITEIFDPQTNKWSTGPSLPKSLSGYALAVFEGRLYIFGGWDGKKVVNDVYMLDTTTNTWSTLNPMPTPRSYAGAILIDGKIYVIGGWDGEKALTVNERYQPWLSGDQEQWTEAPPLPFGQYGMGVANLSNIIFVIGGIESDKQLTAIALFPEETDWVKIDTPLDDGWAFLGTTTIGTRFYALGGKTKEGLFSKMWSYQAIYTISLPIVR